MCASPHLSYQLTSCYPFGVPAFSGVIGKSGRVSDLRLDELLCRVSSDCASFPADSTFRDDLEDR